jgi:hypothetical protein
MRRTLARLALIVAVNAAILVGAWLVLPAGAVDAADPVVAQRGAVTVTASEVRRILAAMDPDTRKQVESDPNQLAQRVRERVLQLAVLDRAHGEKFDTRPDVLYRAQLARDGAIADSYVATKLSTEADFPSEQQIAAAYEANKARFQMPRRYHLAQILLTIPANAAPATVEHVRQQALELRKQITDGHADFAALARQRSDDKTTAQNGGEIGWLREEVLLPPIRQALVTMAPGAVSDPVRTPDGWHLVLLAGVQPAGQASLEEARDTLVRIMRQERTVQEQRKYLNDMLQEQPIKIDQVELWKQVAQ